jgi:hypothetical protein
MNTADLIIYPIKIIGDTFYIKYSDEHYKKLMHRLSHKDMKNYFFHYFLEGFKTSFGCNLGIILTFFSSFMHPMECLKYLAHNKFTLFLIFNRAISIGLFWGSYFSLSLSISRGCEYEYWLKKLFLVNITSWFSNIYYSYIHFIFSTKIDFFMNISRSGLLKYMFRATLETREDLYTNLLMQVQTRRLIFLNSICLFFADYGKLI